MIAAIYARKSTEQAGIADEQPQILGLAQRLETGSQQRGVRDSETAAGVVPSSVTPIVVLDRLQIVGLGLMGAATLRNFPKGWVAGVNQSQRYKVTFWPVRHERYTASTNSRAW